MNIRATYLLGRLRLAWFSPQLKLNTGDGFYLRNPKTQSDVKPLLVDKHKQSGWQRIAFH